MTAASVLRDLAGKATPGPWRASVYDTAEEARVVGDGGSEGDLVAYCDGRRDLRYRENARLIALAPELALKHADLLDWAHDVAQELEVLRIREREEIGESPVSDALLARLASLVQSQGDGGSHSEAGEDAQ